MIPTIAHDEMTLNGKKIIIDTAQLSPSCYETMALYAISGDELDSQTTGDREEALHIHAAMLKRFQRKAQDHPLSGKYLALSTALKAADLTTLVKYADHEDGGTCNFDSPALYLPRWNARSVEQAAKAAGLRCFKWKLLGQGGWYVFSMSICGQGNRRMYAAEHMTQLLKEAGYDAFCYQQID